MCTPSKILAIALLSVVLPAYAQQGRLDSRSTMHITLPEDSPVSVMSADWGESNATPRGGAMLLDLHTSLVLKNTGQRRIRGITLLVQAQELTPGGKASVSVPSLNIPPGQTFPVRIDLSLLRPLQAGSGPLVEIALDGILFDDLSFFGPNRLNSRRSMTVWELEATRDRQYFKEVLQSKGRDGLRAEMISSLNKQAERTHMDARVTAGRATATASTRQVQLAFVNPPNAPVVPEQGYARVVNDEARMPQIVIRNQSDRAIESLELGWIVKDARGREFVTGAIPVDVSLAPRARSRVVQDASFRFTEAGGQGITIDTMTAFFNSVQYSDGKMWVPDRSKGSPTPSPEEQRLVELYRRKGIDVLMEELKRY
jgi:hypothetical protein